MSILHSLNNLKKNLWLGLLMFGSSAFAQIAVQDTSFRSDLWRYKAVDGLEILETQLLILEVNTFSNLSSYVGIVLTANPVLTSFEGYKTYDFNYNFNIIPYTPNYLPFYYDHHLRKNTLKGLGDTVFLNNQDQKEIIVLTETKDLSTRDFTNATKLKWNPVTYQTTINGTYRLSDQNFFIPPLTTNTGKTPYCETRNIVSLNGKLYMNFRTFDSSDGGEDFIVEVDSSTGNGSKILKQLDVDGQGSGYQSDIALYKYRNELIYIKQYLTSNNGFCDIFLIKKTEPFEEKKILTVSFDPMYSPPGVNIRMQCDDNFNCYLYSSMQPFKLDISDSASYLKKINIVFDVKTIVGNVFIPTDNACTTTSSNLDKHLNLPLVKVDQMGIYATPDSNGRYQLEVPSNYGNVNVRLFDYEKNGRQICPDSSYRINFDSSTTDTCCFDFYYKINECSKLAISLNRNRTRRCFNGLTDITVSNKGFSAENVKIHVEYPEYIVPISSLPPWSSIDYVNHSVEYTFASVVGFGTTQISITDSVSCSNEQIRNNYLSYYGHITSVNSCQNIDTSIWDNSNLQLTSFCTTLAGRRIKIKNIGTGVMADSTFIQLFAHDTLFGERKIKLSAKDSLVFDIVSEKSRLTLVVANTQSNPFRNYVFKNLKSCSNTGFDPYYYNYSNRYHLLSGNETIFNALVRDSYDPNDKTALPFSLNTTTGSDLYPNNPINYTIRFQNTGSDTAYKVIVVDSLDASLDEGTIASIVASHPYQFNIVKNKRQYVTKFSFDNINLPDSTTDERGSHGFVSFSIYPKANTPLSSTIKNEADIYFDFNSAIRTNEVKHFLTRVPNPEIPNQPALRIVNQETMTGVETIIGSTIQFIKNESFSLYPNPAFQYIIFQNNTPELLNYTISDLYGRIMIMGIAHGLEKTPISITDFPGSMYIMSCKGQRKTFVKIE